MSKLAKIILITGIVTAVGALAYFGWYYLFGAKSASITPTTTPAVNAVPKPLTSDRVFDYWLNTTNNSLYYVAEDGSINQLDASGNSAALGSQTIGQLSEVRPSPDGSKILVGFGFPQSPTFAVYTMSTKSWLSLPGGVVSAAWDPASSNRLLYLKDSGSASQLAYFTLSDQKTKIVGSFAQKDLSLEWIIPSVVYFEQRPANSAAGSLWSYNLTSGAVKVLVREEAGLDLRWGNGGKNAVKWSAGGLRVIDQNNKTLSGIPLLTLASKCAFDSLRIYCAAPANQASVGADTLPDNYLKKTLYTNDDIYIVSLLGLGTRTELLTIKNFDALASGVAIKAERPKIFGGKFYFINEFDRRLYSLDL